MTNLHSYITDSKNDESGTDNRHKLSQLLLLCCSESFTPLHLPLRVCRAWWSSFGVTIAFHTSCRLNTGTSMRTMGTGSGFIYSWWKTWQRLLIWGLRGMFKVALWQNHLYRADAGGWKVCVLLMQDICRTAAIGLHAWWSCKLSQQGQKGSGEKRKSGCQKRTK